jgi:hypothetical protein
LTVTQSAGLDIGADGVSDAQMGRWNRRVLRAGHNGSFVRVAVAFVRISVAFSGLTWAYAETRCSCIFAQEVVALVEKQRLPQ